MKIVMKPTQKLDATRSLVNPETIEMMVLMSDAKDKTILISQIKTPPKGGVFISHTSCV